MVQRAAGQQDRGIAALAVRQDVEGDAGRQAGRDLAVRLLHAVVRRRLQVQGAGQRIDGESMVCCRAGHAVGVGAGDDARRRLGPGVPAGYLSWPSFATAPVSTLTRRFTPPMPITRSRSATGLKSTMARPPLSKRSFSG